MPTNKYPQNQSGLEDDIKSPNPGQPGKRTGIHEEESTDTSTDLRDGDGALELEDEEQPTRVGDDIGDKDGQDDKEDGDETETSDDADNDAGYDGGAKTQPR